MSAEHFKADYHVHSNFSPDGAPSVEENLEAAVRQGLDSLICTDHCECNAATVVVRKEENRWPLLAIDEYYDKISSLLGRYPLSVGIGVELGQPTQNLEVAERIVAAKDWDLILGSNHNIRGEGDFCWINYAGRDLEALCHQYFSELYEVVEWGKFDIVSHIYYFIKYIVRAGFEVDLSKFDADIADIFRLMISKNIGLEVNTSCLRDQYGKTVPGLEHLKLYRSLGGELVTVGSDSHRAETVGAGGDVARALLSEAGFRYTAFYSKRIPTLMPI